MPTQYLSQQKHDGLSAELAELQDTKMPQLATRIDDARQMGDLKENAEYHQAREDLGWAKGRVKEIEAILANSEIITSRAPGSHVTVGSMVTVTVNGSTRTYTIVGAQEADPAAGHISNESPLGSAFIGRQVGDSVEVTVPAGTQQFTIDAIE
jgi:transcription elongation factor GreA